MKNLLIVISIVIFAAALAFAQGQSPSNVEKGTVHSMELPVIQTQLKSGPGLDKVSTLCNICHSLDYITMQPPFPRATWTAEVNKMIKVMGAPINEEDAKTISDYLATNYGTGK
ncbi:MAG TPA: cytochrome c [Nitrospirota bacterium]|nr:cytochrome c [Nitrospirota bacterium]